MLCTGMLSIGLPLHPEYGHTTRYFTHSLIKINDTLKSNQNEKLKLSSARRASDESKARSITQFVTSGYFGHLISSRWQSCERLRGNQPTTTKTAKTESPPPLSLFLAIRCATVLKWLMTTIHWHHLFKGLKSRIDRPKASAHSSPNRGRTTTESAYLLGHFLQRDGWSFWDSSCCHNIACWFGWGHVVSSDWPRTQRRLAAGWRT